MNTRPEQVHHPEADHETHLPTNEARAGSTPHIVRYVLLISLVLAILALSAIWITGAFNAPQETGIDADTVSAVQQQSSPNTPSDPM